MSACTGHYMEVSAKMVQGSSSRMPKTIIDKKINASRNLMHLPLVKDENHNIISSMKMIREGFFLHP